MIFVKKSIFIYYLISSFITLAIYVWISQIYQIPWTIPSVYGGDGLWFLTIIQSLIENDWLPFGLIQSSRLGGGDMNWNLADFPIPEPVLFLIIKGISIFSSSAFTLFKIYFILTFFLSHLSTYFVCRKLRLHPAISAVIATLFALLPYHFVRLHHTSLASYFMIPLQGLVLLWLGLKKPLFFDLTDRKSILSILIIFVATSMGVYYSFFFVFFCLIAGLASASYWKSKKHILSTAIAIGITTITFGINLFPNFYYWKHHGKNPAVASRDRYEANFHALKLPQFLLPSPQHRSPFFAEIRSKYKAPFGDTEGFNEPVGIIGVIGFLSLIFYLLFLTLPSPKTPTLYRLALFQGFGILFGTFGGFGSLVAILISPSIRCYNRISVFLSFFALLAFGILLQRIYQKYRHVNYSSLFLAPFLIGILAFGIWDQTNASYQTPNVTEEYLSDSHFVQEVEKTSSPGDRILQLPFIAFPETPSPTPQMDSHDHFKAFLLSRTLIWSFGAIKGRDASRKIEYLSFLPLNVPKIIQEGFQGIYIDRNGFLDRGVEVEAQLESQLHQKPLVSQNGRLSYFKLPLTLP